ncbi:hypothetical protein JCM1840_004824, partial [Sporobolomyces johnsonii]
MPSRTSTSARSTTAGVSYTPPAVFFELEDDFKQQKRRKSRSKSAKGVKKLSEKHNVASDLEDEVDELASEEEDGQWTAEKENVSAQKKKRKTVKGKGSGKAGGKNGGRGLGTLSDELLTRIFSHLDSPSLLHLSLTSKHLRSLLVSPDQKPLWLAARQLVGLPDWETQPPSEQAYAELIFGGKCQACDKAGGHVDPFLHKRLCKACRKSSLVHVAQLKKTHPWINAAAALCCLSTRLSPSDPSHLSKSKYVPLLSLLHFDALLLPLQEKDDDDREREIWSTLSGTHGGGSRSRGKEGGSMAIPEYGSDEGKMGKRVARFVQKRSGVLEALEKDGKALFDVLQQLDLPLAVGRHSSARGGTVSGMKRREAIEQRVLEIEGYTEADFCPTWSKATLVIEGSDEISDEAWEALKPGVLKVLEHCRKRRSTAELKTSQHERRDALRPRYNKLRDAEASPEARSYFPLFADFVLFPAVKSLWEADQEIGDALWTTSIPSILEQLNDWRVEVRLAAIQLILARTIDLPADEELDPDADAYDTETYDSGWFELLTSLLCCDISDCAHKHKSTPSPDAPLLRGYTFFGPLFALLEHQHTSHADLAPSPKPGATPQFRFSLPLEVATAVSALVELGELNDEEATAEDLDDAMQGTRVQWKPLPGGGAGRKEVEWRKV